MKKEEKSTPLSAKTRSIYKYELQATNQILKDTIDIYPSSLHSTAQTNRHNNAQLQQFDQYLFDQNQSRKYFSVKNKLQDSHLFKKDYIFQDQKLLNSQEQNKLQHRHFFQNYNLKDSNIKPKLQRSKRQIDHDIDNMHSSQICSFSSENQENPNNFFHPSRQKLNENVVKKDKSDDLKKQLRQKRGLANISLKVKNIVAKKGKMTYKQVSDEVLKESEQDLPIECEQRQKEMKNIRRRVYDALNVLVSVGILGKEQRCVIHTQFTNIPGKKLSSHWELITEKNRLLGEKKEGYKNKLANLNQLKKQYELTLLLYERNRSFLSGNKQICQSKLKQQLIIHPQQDRFNFPLIFLVPPKKHMAKIKVQIEYEEREKECIKKFVVDGNQYILTQLQLLKRIDFPSQVQLEKINEIKDKISNLQFVAQKKILEDEISFVQKYEFFNEDIYLED